MAGKLNITIEQGAKFSLSLLWTDSANAPIALGTYKARMMIRHQIDDAAPLVDLTSDAGDIDLEPGAVTGKIVVNIGATATDLLGVSGGVYDLELFDSVDVDDVVRLVEGKVFVKRAVTR